MAQLFNSANIKTARTIHSNSRIHQNVHTVINMQVKLADKERNNAIRKVKKVKLSLYLTS
jgi:hypothetical protein